MRLDLTAVYVALAAGAAVGLWVLGRRLGAVGLLVLTSPIHRPSLDVGFSLKAFYVVIAGLIALNLWRARGDPFRLRLNTFAHLALLFLGAVVVSLLINGATNASVSHVVVFALVFAGCYLVLARLRGPDDVQRVVDAYLLTGLFLGLTGLIFYSLWFIAPALYVPGSLFDAVTYNPDQPWTLPLLQGVDIGSNGYALNLLPFTFVALGVSMNSEARRRRWLGLVTSALLFLNLVLTGSRGGFLAFLGAALVWAFTLPRRTVLKVTLAAILLALTPLAPRAVDLYRQYSYLKGVYSGEDAALLSNRDQLAEATLKVFTQSPVFGVGEGNLSEGRYVGKQAHNSYLELLAENGIVGFTLYATIIAWLAWYLLRHRPAFRARDAYAICHMFGCGYLALLLAIVPTSALTIPLIWMQPTVLIGLVGIYCDAQARAKSTPQPSV